MVRGTTTAFLTISFVLFASGSYVSTGRFKIESQTQKASQNGQKRAEIMHGVVAGSFPRLNWCILNLTRAAMFFVSVSYQGKRELK